MLGAFAAKAACAALVAVLLASLAAQLSPLVQRLRRLQLVLVPPHEKAEGAVRIGLLGASFIGRAAVVHAAEKRRDVIVVAVAARDAARAAAYAARHGIASSYGGAAAYEELLRHPGLDAVYVGLPTRLHDRWTSAALAAGKHVLVEKPLASNAAEEERLRKSAARAGRLLFEGAHYRYHPAPRRVRELLAQDGTLGRLASLEARFSMLDPKAWASSMVGKPFAPSSDDRLHERVKNLDRWWYCVDSLLWASGAISARVVSAEERRFSVSARLALTLPLPSASGGVAKDSYVVNATVEMARDKLSEPFDWSLQATGEHGALRLSNLGFPFLWHRVSLDSAEGRRTEQHYGEGETTFEHQLGAFVEAVRAHNAPREPDSLPVPSTMAVVDEIYRAAGSEPIPSSTS